VFNGTNESQIESYPTSGQYPVILTITDAIGCTDEYSIIIDISDPLIWVPNVFTPNDDGVNDLFTLPFDGFKSYNILILNRWGNVMWDQSRSKLVSYFGTVQITGQEKCKDGVYFYKLSGEQCWEGLDCQ